jgi:hypothetical protein
VIFCGTNLFGGNNLVGGIGLYGNPTICLGLCVVLVSELLPPKKSRNPGQKDWEPETSGLGVAC